MQITANLYQAWEVRTPLQDSETFKGAIARIESHARELGIETRWRKGHGQRNVTARYHYWEVRDEVQAVTLMMACGDKVNIQIYKE